LSNEFVALDISPSPNASFVLLFNDTKSIFHHERYCQEMTGNQLNCHFTQQNWLKMNGKKVDYLPFPLPPLFWNTWDCIRCKIAKRGDVNDQRNNKKI
jgi:hypothetical protein